MDPPVIGALIAAGVGVVTLMANVALRERARRDERLAVVAAFRSDIRSLVDVLDRMGIVESFVQYLRSPQTTPRWINAPRRREDYFRLFGALASKIGLTPRPLAREIVRFYIFLHASRDSARHLGELKPMSADEDKRLEQVRNVLVALEEVLTAAEVALDRKFSAIGECDGQALAKRLKEEIQHVLSSTDQSALSSQVSK